MPDVNECEVGKPANRLRFNNTEAELQSCTARPVYDAALWRAVKSEQTGNVVAIGIAEPDREIGEGILEWIQVSRNYHGCGLGRCIVSELLWRMKGTADFAAVSGQCHNPNNPKVLYRLMKNGVPKSAILYEDRATNSMENAVYSAKAAKDAGIKEKCAIICCQAFHARRAFLSYTCHFDGAELMAVPNVTQGVAKMVGTNPKRATRKSWAKFEIHEGALPFPADRPAQRETPQSGR